MHLPFALWVRFVCVQWSWRLEGDKNSSFYRSLLCSLWHVCIQV
jgi:hypothetical protein